MAQTMEQGCFRRHEGTAGCPAADPPAHHPDVRRTPSLLMKWPDTPESMQCFSQRHAALGHVNGVGGHSSPAPYQPQRRQGARPSPADAICTGREACFPTIHSFAGSIPLTLVLPEHLLEHHPQPRLYPARGRVTRSPYSSISAAC